MCDWEMAISWNLSSNLQLSLVFLYANSLYASLFFESLSLAYNNKTFRIVSLVLKGHMILEINVQGRGVLEPLVKAV